jgi:hypothetical protein
MVAATFAVYLRIRRRNWSNGGNPMNRPTRALVTAAFSLLSVLSAQAANTKIFALPFNITSPGTYILAANLTSPVTPNQSGAINISVPTTGAVILDLNGFTITGTGGFSWGIAIINYSASANAYPITIRNGTITNFGYCVEALGAGGTISNITVNKVVFNPSPPVSGAGSTGVSFSEINSSTLKNCTFNSAYWAITDVGSQGGNAYNNLTFAKTIYSITVELAASPSTLNQCDFAAPPSN